MCIFQKAGQLLIPLFVAGSAYCIFKGNDIFVWIKSGFGGYWFLYVLAILSIFFILFERIARVFSRCYLYAGLWIIPYCLFVFMKIKHIEIGGGSLIPINHFVNYYRYYLIGWLCHKYKYMNKFLLENKIVYPFAFIVYLLQWHYCDYHNMFLIFAGALGAIIVLQSWFYYRVNDSHTLKILSHIGRNSLNIYIFHYFFIPDVSNVMYDFLNVENPFIWTLLFSLLLAIPIVLASCFIGDIVNHNKYLRFVILGK